MRSVLAALLSTVVLVVVAPPQPAAGGTRSSSASPATPNPGVRAGTPSAALILTAAHCGAVNAAVYGHDARFGTLAHSKLPTDDTALIREIPPNDAYQIVVDPLTGRTPGGSGKVVGVLSSSNFTNGYLVGKMGRVTGWTEGKIYGESEWFGRTVYCSRASVQLGDSGGPVWRTAPNGGVYALGITVIRDEGTGGACFYALSRLLRVWGATLPVFPSGYARTQDEASVSAPEAEGPQPRLPWIDPSRLRPL